MVQYVAHRPYLLSLHRDNVTNIKNDQKCTFWQPTSRSRRGRMKLKIVGAHRSHSKEQYAISIMKVG